MNWDDIITLLGLKKTPKNQIINRGYVVDSDTGRKVNANSYYDSNGIIGIQTDDGNVHPIDMPEVTVYPNRTTLQQMAINRILHNGVNDDFTKALDIPENIRKEYTPKYVKTARYNGRYSDFFNCINTATRAAIPDKSSVSSNITFYNNPEKFGFKRVSNENAVAGDLVQYGSPSFKREGNEFVEDTTKITPHHAGIVIDINDKNNVQIKSASGSETMNPVRPWNTRYRQLLTHDLTKETVPIEELYGDYLRFYRYMPKNEGVYINGWKNGSQRTNIKEKQ